MPNTEQLLAQSPLPVLNENTLTAQQFLTQYEGRSFFGGMYRLLRKADIPKWNALIGEAFPPALGNVEVFGCDWQGRMFAVDSDIGTVIIFEPGTGEGFDTEKDLVAFHNEELKCNHQFCLMSDYLQEWLDAGKPIPGFDQCAGYIVPLFLNGKDEIENLEICDMEVYWSIMAPLIQM